MEHLTHRWLACSTQLQIAVQLDAGPEQKFWSHYILRRASFSPYDSVDSDGWKIAEIVFKVIQLDSKTFRPDVDTFPIWANICYILNFHYVFLQ